MTNVCQRRTADVRKPPAGTTALRRSHAEHRGRASQRAPRPPARDPRHQCPVAGSRPRRP